MVVAKMLKSSVCLFVLLIIHVYCDDFYRCPTSFKEATGEKRIFSDRCYLFVPTEVTGDSAFKRCQSMSGGNPVEILNADTQNFLVSTIRSLDTWKDKNGIWIGFTDNSHWTGNSGVWTWLASGTRADKWKGYPDPYMNWAEGEPAAGFLSIEDYTDDCASLRRGDNYKWRDRNCHLPTHFYICQFNMGPRTTTTTTTTTTTMRPPPTKRPTMSPSTTSTTLKTTTTTTASILLTDKVQLGGSLTSNPTITESDENLAIHAAEAAKIKDSEGHSGNTNTNTNTATGLGIGIGLGILLVLAVVLILFVCRRRRKKHACEEQTVSFHNNQYTDQRMDVNVYSDINETEYTEVGGAEAAPLASPTHNTYSNCSLLSRDTSANKKNEAAELARCDSEYAVPQVNQYAVPNTPPPTYFPPGLPPSYDEAAEGETVEDAVTTGPVGMVRNDLYESAEPSGAEHEVRTPVLVTNQLYDMSQ